MSGVGGGVVRPMRWWDIADLMPLERELFSPDTWSEEAFWSELATPGRSFVVIRDAGADGDDGVVLGYAGVAVNGATADVQTIAVSPAAQGRGLGRVLLDALVKRAVEGGATELLLEVRADNAPAQKLYLSSGFEQISVRRGYYQPGAVDALIMRRRPLTDSDSGSGRVQPSTPPAVSE